mmetsp:Transcript_25203/g.25413  ORF Transcript_25203/g.25413 Transcript_25203/m.25413 type:complete len:753 (-) Transcript_25203:306-2564(-)|eukprot:CAMPEP_0182420516 /NCGR_PEP_ID=MMETSP1167-20130531/5372_1 /TAXON_ID=2988 /ORGANISM="Mallomonas Sp, Strain CCMP3275" /LENGTH=752 /DNA_ID=CAMNT_0024596557 /DNA_START=72 /DNA_END=2330 /DNA_ORIENTATION=+
MDKEQTQTASNNDAEWGWTEVESEDNPPDVDVQPVSKVPSMSKMMDSKQAAVAIGNASLSNGIKSSPSFQELENAIGATLAMSLSDTDQNQAYLDYQRQQNYKFGLTSPRTYQPRQYRQQQLQNTRIPKSRLKSGAENLAIMNNTRTELEMFINEAESRAIIVFHSPNLSPSAIRNACQMFGVLYYLRPEFHFRGVTLLGYFDLRAAINAHRGLPDEIGGQDSSVSVHFSVMLHTSNNCEESRLVIRHLPNGRSEADVQSTCTRYGQLRSIQRTFDGVEDQGADTGEATSVKHVSAEFTVEYFNIQDARLAASELSVNVIHVWGSETSVKFSPLDNRKQQLCRQLLVLLSRWRSDVSIPSSSSFGDLTQQHTMALQQQQQQYHMPTYGHMEMPVGLGMVMPGYGQVQYGHPYVQQSVMMGRGGMPVAMSHGHPYGMGATPVMYSGAMQSPYASHGITHGIPQIALRSGMGHHDEEDPNAHWDGVQGIVLGTYADKNQYYAGMPPQSQPRQMHGREPYPERPPHHNGGHIGQMRRGTRPGGGGGLAGVGLGSNDADYALDLEKVASGADTRTTLMIRNIPNKYTQVMLLNEINVRHEGTYDFYYLPIDFKNRCNVGYAFINFMEPKHIIPFFKDFNNQRWSNFNSEKVCALSFARIQGKASMVARFQNSSLLEKDNEYRPLLFVSSGPDKGKPEPFPTAQHRQQLPPPRGSPQSRADWENEEAAAAHEADAQQLSIAGLSVSADNGRFVVEES